MQRPRNVVARSTERRFYCKRGLAKPKELRIRRLLGLVPRPEASRQEFVALALDRLRLARRGRRLLLAKGVANLITAGAARSQHEFIRRNRNTCPVLHALGGCFALWLRIIDGDYLKGVAVSHDRSVAFFDGLDDPREDNGCLRTFDD